MEMTGPCSSVNFTSTMTAVGVRTDFRDDADRSVGRSRFDPSDTQAGWRLVMTNLCQEDRNRPLVLPELCQTPGNFGSSRDREGKTSPSRTPESVG